MAEVPVSTIIQSTISLRTRGITQAGFGTLMFLTDEDSGWGSERARRYASVDEVLEDFASSTDTYKAAVAYFSQSPHPEELVIGAEGSRVAQVVTLVFSADLITSNVVTVTIDGTTITETYATSNAATLTALAAQIQALASVATAVSDGTHTITITAATAGASISVGTAVVTLGASQATCVTTTTVDNHGPAEDVAEIKDEDGDFYGVAWNERTAALVLEMAAYIETTSLIFGTVSDDVDIYDDTVTDDIASLLSAAGYQRTFLIWNADPLDFAECAWMGNCFTFSPGAETWKFKTLIGITADEPTTSQRTAIEGKNCNQYYTIAGTDNTAEGVMASGEYIDVIRFADFLNARIAENCFLALRNRPKIGLTNKGIAILENQIRGVLANGQSVGGISDDALEPDSNVVERATKPYVVTVPDSSDIAAADRADRHVTGITWEARLAGAIHSAVVTGSLTV